MPIVFDVDIMKMKSSSSSSRRKIDFAWKQHSNTKKTFFFLSSSSLLLHEMKHQHPPFCVMFSFSFCSAFHFMLLIFYTDSENFQNERRKYISCVCVYGIIKGKKSLLRADEGRIEKGDKMDTNRIKSTKTISVEI